MNNVKSIRNQLGVSRKELAVALDCTEGNIGHIETGRVPLLVPRAAMLIAFAKTRGVEIGYDDIYAVAEPGEGG